MKKIIILSMLLALMCPPVWGQEAMSEDNFGNMKWRYWNGSARADLGFLGYDSGTDFKLYDSDGDSGLFYDGSASTFALSYNALDSLFLNTATSALTLGRAGADQDVIFTWQANTNSGVLTWMEDEDYFRFNDDVMLVDDEKLIFGSDSDIWLSSSTDKQLDITAGGEITLNFASGSAIYWVLQDTIAMLTLDASNTIFGYEAGLARVTGQNNVFAGYQAVGDGADDDQDDCVVFGYKAGLKTEANSSVFIGSEVAYSHSTGDANVIIGHRAAYEAAAGVANNVIIGHRAGYEMEGSGCVLLGYNAGYKLEGDNSFIGGYQAAYNATTMDSAVIIGYQAGYDLTTVNSQILIGYRAGYNLTTGGTGNIIVGYQGGRLLTTGDNNSIFGYNANYAGGADASRNVIIGMNAGYNLEGENNVIAGREAGYPLTSANCNTIVGYRAVYSAAVGVDNTTAIGYQAGYNIEGNNSTFAGYQAGYSLEDGLYNVALGYKALYSNVSGTQGFAIGHESLYNNIGNYNVAIGYRALYESVGSSNNIAIGSNCQRENTSGGSNTVFGSTALYYNETGESSVAIGHNAMRGTVASTDPDKNVAIGYRAGYVLESDNSTIIGYQAGLVLAANGACVFIGYEAGKAEVLANKLYISNSDTATPLIGGTFPNTALVFTTDSVTMGTGGDVDPVLTFNTDNNDGTITFDRDNDLFSSSSVLRTDTSLYVRYYHLAIAAFDPGASGATWTPAGANNLAGFQLNADGEILQFGTDVHSDWDGTTDLTVEINFQLLDAGNPADTVDLQLVCYYMGTGDVATKTQSETVAVATDGTQFKMYQATFTINFDEGGNVVDVGDKMSCVLNLVTATSEIDNILVSSGSYFYSTTHTGIEAGDA